MAHALKLRVLRPEAPPEFQRARIFILLIIVHIPTMVTTFIVPTLTTTIALFVVNSFIDGLLAKNVAGWWKEEKPEYEREHETTKTLLKKCANCGREIPIASEECM